MYDHSPFVERNVLPDETIDLWKLKLAKRAYSNLAQRISEGLGLAKTYLRHPRLYQFEDEEIDSNAVVVHVTGISGAAAGMPDHVIDHISKRYRNSTVFQIGGHKDENTPFIDRRGLPLWDSIPATHHCDAGFRVVAEDRVDGERAGEEHPVGNG